MQIRNFINSFIIVGAVLTLTNNVCADTKIISGTETPETYANKSEIIKKAEKQNRSALIQEVSKLYREMVSSFKAKRIEHAEEVSQRLTLLLQDPVLPEKFAEKISRKQQLFLARVYEQQPEKFLDLESDTLTDDEVSDLKKEISKKTTPQSHISSGVVIPEPKPVTVTQTIDLPKPAEVESLETVGPEKTLSRAEKKALARQKKIEEKKRIRAEKLAAKEARRQKKIALKKERAKKRAVAKALKHCNVIQSSSAGTQTQKTSDVIAADMTQTTDAINAMAREAHGISVEDAKAEDDRFSLLMDQVHKKRQNEIDAFIKDYREKIKKTQDEIQKEFLARIEQLYRDALELNKNKAYRTSLDLFLEIEKLLPDYKLTRHYIADLQKRLEISGTTPIKYNEIVSSSLDEYSKAHFTEESSEAVQ